MLVQTRAALIGQLLSLVYGSSTARLSVVEALMAALNANSLSLDRRRTDRALNKDIADALAGDPLNGRLLSWRDVG